MTVQTLTGNTPFSLVYGCEVAIPLEIQILSFLVALETKITEGDNDRLHLQEMAAQEKNWLKLNTVLSCTKLESRRPSIKESRRVFQTGDLVLAIR